MYCPKCSYSNLIQYSDGSYECPLCKYHFMLIERSNYRYKEIEEEWYSIPDTKDYEVSSHYRVRRSMKSWNYKYLSVYPLHGSLYVNLYRLDGSHRVFNVKHLFDLAKGGG